MKQLAFICLLVAIVAVAAGLAAVQETGSWLPFVHSVGTLFFAGITYSTFTDTGEPPHVK
jgi:hypothetical protein